MAGEQTLLPQVVQVLSARHDGGTTVAVGLAAVLSAERRVLLADLCRRRAEIAPLLDLNERPSVFQLAFRSQLSPISGPELEAHVQWSDGVGVLPGVANRDEGEELTEHFVRSLLARAAGSFDHVVVDAGCPEPAAPPAPDGAVRLWVVRPSPLGLTAFDKLVRELASSGAGWWRSARVVLNQVSDRAFADAGRLIEGRYGLSVAGSLPWASDYWQRVEAEHSVRALSVPLPDEGRFKRAYGQEALATRRAFHRLAGALISPPQETRSEALEA